MSVGFTLPLRDVLLRHRITARKSRGQHFILDRQLHRRIVEAAGPVDGGVVLEPGAGPGGLTCALLEAGAAHVHAFETDRRCVAALDELACRHRQRLTVHHRDALTAPPFSHFADGGKVIVAANLPYNIASLLLAGWLPQMADCESLTLLVQEELAQRLAAKSGRAFGRLSVRVQRLCTVRRLFSVNSAAFTPPPAVASRLIRLEPRPQPLAEADEESLCRVLAAAFGARRKTLKKSLASLGVDSGRLLREAGVEAHLRAEQLDVEGFCRLARAQTRGV